MKGNDIMSEQEILIQEGGGTRTSNIPPIPPAPPTVPPTSSSNTQR